MLSKAHLPQIERTELPQNSQPVFPVGQAEPLRGTTLRATETSAEHRQRWIRDLASQDRASFLTIRFDGAHVPCGDTTCPKDPLANSTPIAPRLYETRAIR